jgi:radical SAM protein with 4Fe4S-binding SPASM domain
LKEDSWLSLINTKTIPLNKKGKLLLFNSDLATWCFLEGRERILYDYLHEGVSYSTLLTASLLKENGLDGVARLDSLLTHLYERGMLIVDNKISLNQNIYSQGPLFSDIPLLELLITKRCNMGCAYCFAEDKQKKQDMKLETAFRAVDHLMEIPSHHFYIKFDGGEPLLRRDLLEEIGEYTIEKLQKVKKEGYLLFEVTTNGTLIDSRAIDLFKRFNMRVLISLDGPEGIHNKTRPYKDGSPSYQDVIKVIRLMQDAYYPFRIITVVTQQNLPFPSEIIDFYSVSGLKEIRFNPVLENGRAKDSWTSIGITPLQYLSFMKTVINGCCGDTFCQEDNIQSMLRNMVCRTRNFKCMRTNCGCGHQYICVDTNGDLYPCAYFRAESPFLKLGNIQEIGKWMDCGQNHPLVRDFPTRIPSKIDVCNRCDWKHLCEGGCTLGAYLQSNTLFAPTYLCEYFKSMYSFLFAKLAEQPDFINRMLGKEVNLEKV